MQLAPVALKRGARAQVRQMQLACVLQGRHRGMPVTAVSWCGALTPSASARGLPAQHCDCALAARARPPRQALVPASLHASTPLPAHAGAEPREGAPAGCAGAPSASRGSSPTHRPTCGAPAPARRPARSRSLHASSARRTAGGGSERTVCCHAPPFWQVPGVLSGPSTTPASAQPPRPPAGWPRATATAA